MIVDTDKWKDKRNRLSPRFLTRDKDADLRKQVALVESLGVIEKSTASKYSQVHLVRKPDQSWRLCIDFKNLNDATESEECGLPGAVGESVALDYRSGNVDLTTTEL
jgi:hypothetical protein